MSEPGISAAQTASGFRVRELPLAPRNDDNILVIAGLDPAIHPKTMDARVKPAHDVVTRGCRVPP
ncbi:hypothetical protein ACJMQP_05985 [Rhodopseudomonas palustris]